ncbi:hypothetical protein CRG98_021635, partial [Punica granatum]
MSLLLSCSGVIPFGYVPTTFLHRGPSPTGTSRQLCCTGAIPFGYVPTTFLLKGHPLRVRPDYFSAQGSVPYRYVPTTFLLKGHPLRVRPDYFSAQGSVPYRYVPTTFLLKGHPLRVRPDYFSAQGSVPYRYVPTTFLLKGHPLRVRPDYFSAQGSVPYRYVPTTFLLKGHPLRVRPDYFSAQGSVPYRYVPTTFLLKGHPLRVRPDYFSAQGSVPYRYVPTTFLLKGHPLRVRPDYFSAQGSVPYRYVPTTFLLRGHPLRVRPDYFSAQGSVPYRYVPTTFLLRGHPLRVRPDYFSAQGSVPFGYVLDYFSAQGSSPSGTSRLISCTGVIPFGYVSTTFLLRGHPLRVRPDYFSAQGSVPFGYVLDYFSAQGSSPSGTSRLISCTGVIPFGYVSTTFLLRGHPHKVRPEYFSAQRSVPFGYVPTILLHRGHPLRRSVPFGYVPTILLHRGHPLRGHALRVCPDYFSPQGSSPSGTSRLLFCTGSTGVCPLRVRPVLLFCTGIIPIGYVPTTFLLRGHALRVGPDYFSPQGSSPSGTSRLLFCTGSTGVCPLRVRPVLLFCTGIIPIGYVPTTFLLRGHALRVGPDYFSPQGSSPSGTSRLLFCTGSTGVCPLRVRPVLLFCTGIIPIGYVPTTFLLRGHALRVGPDYFSPQGSSPSGTSRLLFCTGSTGVCPLRVRPVLLFCTGIIPIGYVPTTFLLRGHALRVGPDYFSPQGSSPSGTSRLLFCTGSTGVCPLRVRPVLLFCTGIIPIGYVPTTFLLRGHALRVGPDYFSPQGSSPSGTSRLLFCTGSTGVCPLRVRPVLLFCTGIIPIGYVPTTFLLRGHALRVGPDYFSPQGSSPSGTSRLLFCTGSTGVCPLRVRPVLLFCTGIIPIGYVPTTFLLRGHALRVGPDYFSPQGSSPSGTSRLLFCTGSTGVCPLRVRPVLLFCTGIIPIGYVPTTFLLRGHALRVGPDYFSPQGSSPSGTSRLLFCTGSTGVCPLRVRPVLLFCTGIIPIGYVPTTFLLRGHALRVGPDYFSPQGSSPSGTSRLLFCTGSTGVCPLRVRPVLLFCTGIIPIGYVPTTFLLRGHALRVGPDYFSPQGSSPSGTSRLLFCTGSTGVCPLRVRPVLLFCTGIIPIGYVPTTFLLRGHALRVGPDYFSPQGSSPSGTSRLLFCTGSTGVCPLRVRPVLLFCTGIIPIGYVPTTFLLRGHALRVGPDYFSPQGSSPSGTSRLLFCTGSTGVCPLRVRPVLLFCTGIIPIGYVPTTFLLRGHALRVGPDYFSPQGSSPSGTSRLLFCTGSTGVCPLRVRPVLLFCTGIIPIGYVPTTFLLRGHALRVGPDYFSPQGSSPSGTSRLLFCTGSTGVCPLRVRPVLLFCTGIIPIGYVPTTFLLRGHALRVGPDYFSPQGSSPSGTSRLLFCTGSTGVCPLRVRPVLLFCTGIIPIGYVPTTFLLRGHPLRARLDYFAAQRSVPFGSVPTTFLLQGHPLVVRSDYFSAQGSSPSGTTRQLFCSGVMPFGYAPTTFLLRGSPLRARPDYFSAQGSSPSGTSRLLFCSWVIPFGYIPTSFLHRGPSPSGTSRLTLLHRGHPLRVRPDYFSAQGSSPSGTSRLFFCTRIIPIGYVPTAFLLMGDPLRVRPDYFSAHGSSPSGTSRLLFCSWVIPFGYVPTIFLHTDHPHRGSCPSGTPRLLFSSGVLPFGHVPTTFLHRKHRGLSPSGTTRLTFLHRDHPHRGSSRSGTSRLLFCSGVIPFGYVPTIFLHKGHPLRVSPDYFPAQGSSPWGTSRLLFCTGIVPFGYVLTTFLHRGHAHR